MKGKIQAFILSSNVSIATLSVLYVEQRYTHSKSVVGYTNLANTDTCISQKRDSNTSELPVLSHTSVPTLRYSIRTQEAKQLQLHHNKGLTNPGNASFSNATDRKLMSFIIRCNTITEVPEISNTNVRIVNK